MPCLKLPERPVSVAGLILDKDGTLHRFDTYWVPLVEARIRALAAEVPAGDVAPLRRRFGLAGMGVAPLGLLAQGTRTEALILAAGWLYEQGLGWTDARRQAEAAFAAADASLPAGQRVLPIPGLTDWLGRWVALGGRLAVASTASRQDVDLALAALGISHLIPHRLGGDEVARGKPHPEMVLRLAAAMALAPGELAVVGDGRNDLQMGRAAGVAACIGVESGVETAADLRPHADLVVSDLTALPLIDISS